MSGATIPTLVSDLVSTRADLASLAKMYSSTLPNKPATAAQITKIEALLGRALPADYRQFLELHDGWPEFSGDNDILSCAQMTGGAMLQQINAIKSQMRSEGDHRAAQGFVIQASLYNWRPVYFDIQKSRAGDDMDVVVWDHGTDARYRSFSAFLQQELKTFKSLLADEQKKLRKPKTKRKSP